jgi:hypothetical protein
MSTASLDHGKTATPPVTNGGFKPSNNAAGIIVVQPPKREDLQPAYAQVLQGDDAAAHGWYGGMSMCSPLSSPFPALFIVDIAFLMSSSIRTFQMLITL